MKQKKKEAQDQNNTELKKTTFKILEMAKCSVATERIMELLLFVATWELIRIWNGIIHLTEYFGILV